jgi:hypothetical protein
VLSGAVARRYLAEMSSKLNGCLIWPSNVQLCGEIYRQSFWSLRFRNRLILVKNQSLEVRELCVV